MRVSSLLIVWAGLSCGAIAMAEGPNPRAQELKAQGDIAMDSRRYDEALADYKAAYELSKDPAILYNMGQVRRARGEYPEALEAFESFDRDASPPLRARVPKLAELLSEVRGKASTIALTTNVAGARVVVRDRVIGTTPLQPFRVNAGKAIIEINADDYLAWKRELNLVGGTHIVIDARLETKNTHGILVVTVPGGPATVVVDRKETGTSPFELTVDAGSHALAIHRDGFEDVESSAVVRAGERHEVDIKLAPKRTIVSRWWFWAGIGALVAGGVIVTTALLLPRAPDMGDRFEPGQVGAPLRW